MIKKAVKISLIISLSLLIIGGTIFAVFLQEFYGANKLSFDKSILLSKTSKIMLYDSKNNLIETASTSNPVISLNALPEYVKHAFIAIEDKNFYSHNGLNYKRMVKALFTNIKNGYAKEGASTISQQLIKNTYLTSEKTYSRKLKEMALTKKLEQNFSKDDILESYLNVIYFGNSSYGIESASQNYFNKPARALTLSEAAMLAGVIKSPKTYSPIYNYENSLNRRNIVLNEMKKDGYITNEAYEKAKNETINITQQNKEFFKRRIYEKASIDEVSKILKLSEQDVATSNLKVYTYMDSDIQNKLEDIVLNPDYYHKNEQGFSADSASIVIDNNTGAIKAFYGKSNYNLSKMKRSPGSSIKPILVYAPALEYGKISPATPILDKKTNFNGYIPHNVGDEYYGWVSARKSLEKSLNIPAIKILNYVGIDKAKAFSEKAGISFDKLDNGQAIALGGLTEGLTVISLANSYMPFSNGGYFAKASFIKKIEDANGKVLYEHKPIKKQIMSEETAYLMTDMLISSVKNGTSHKLDSLDFEVAGKTGTVGLKGTNKNSDAWSVGYTTDVTVCTWLGNSTGNKEHHLEAINNGGTYASMLTRDVLKASHKTKPVSFKKPKNIVYHNIDLLALENEHKVKLASDDVKEIYTVKEVFNKKYEPKQKSNYVLELKKPALVIKAEDNLNTLLFKANKYFIYEVYRVEEDQTKLLETIKDKTEDIVVEDTTIKPDVIYEYYVVVKPLDDESNKFVKSNSVKSIISKKTNQKQKKKFKLFRMFG